MAESQNPTRKTTRRGGKYCVAGLPNNVSCTNTSYTVGISMHRCPKNPETRQKWVKFVRKRRLDFTPTDISFLCSMHFLPTCLTRRQDITVDDIEASTRLKKTLSSGAVPTEDGVDEAAFVLLVEEQERLYGEQCQQDTASPAEAQTKQPRKCRKCGRLLKGHPRGRCPEGN